MVALLAERQSAFEILPNVCKIVGHVADTRTGVLYVIWLGVGRIVVERQGAESIVNCQPLIISGPGRIFFIEYFREFIRQRKKLRKQPDCGIYLVLRHGWSALRPRAEKGCCIQECLKLLHCVCVAQPVAVRVVRETNEIPGDTPI